jgi:hypothetical protein
MTLAFSSYRLTFPPTQTKASRERGQMNQMAWGVWAELAQREDRSAFVTCLFWEGLAGEGRERWQRKFIGVVMLI